jgi:hypothetical protein
MLRRCTYADVWAIQLRREPDLGELPVPTIQILIAAIPCVAYVHTPPGLLPDAPIRAVSLELTLFAVAALVRL